MGASVLENWSDWRAQIEAEVVGEARRTYAPAITILSGQVTSDVSD